MGGCLIAVMPKSKPNTSRDFFKPRSSEGKDGASSGADTLSATPGWDTWLQDLKTTACKSTDGRHEGLDVEQESPCGWKHCAHVSKTFRICPEKAHRWEWTISQTGHAAFLRFLPWQRHTAIKILSTNCFLSALFLPWFFTRSWGVCLLQVGRMQIRNKDGKETVSVSHSRSRRQTSHIPACCRNGADGSPQRDNLYFVSKLTNALGRRQSQTFSTADTLHHGVTTCRELRQLLLCRGATRCSRAKVPLALLAVQMQLFCTPVKRSGSGTKMRLSCSEISSLGCTEYIGHTITTGWDYLLLSVFIFHLVFTSQSISNLFSVLFQIEFSTLCVIFRNS